LSFGWSSSAIGWEVMTKTNNFETLENFQIWSVAAMPVKAYPRSKQ